MEYPLNEWGRESNKCLGEMIQLQSPFSPYFPFPALPLCPQHPLTSERVPRKRTGLGITKSPGPRWLLTRHSTKSSEFPVQIDILNPQPQYKRKTNLPDFLFWHLFSTPSHNVLCIYSLLLVWEWNKGSWGFRFLLLCPAGKLLSSSSFSNRFSPRTKLPCKFKGTLSSPRSAS